MIVLDASAIVDLLLGTPPFAAAVARLVSDHDGDIHAPHLLDAEVGQVFRRYLLAGELGYPRARQALEHLEEAPITRYPHLPLLPRALELRANATVYDGIYIALAESLDIPLVTRDAALGRVPGHRAGVLTLHEQ